MGILTSLPFNSNAYNSPSFAMTGKTSFSIEVGTGCKHKCCLDVMKLGRIKYSKDYYAGWNIS